MKYLVTTGCSLTFDNYQKTWANFLSDRLGLELINIASRGAGIDFICKRLITYLHDKDPTQYKVFIMIPSSDRFDYYVDSDHLLKNDFLKISSWQQGNKPSFMSLDGSLSNDNGYSLTGGWRRGYKKKYYKYYYNKTFSSINYWFNVLYIQNFLKLNNYTYNFTSAYHIDQTIEQEYNSLGEIDYINHIKLIDFNQFILYQNQSGFLDYVKDKNYEIIKNHPIEEAHENYVDEVLLPKLESIKN
jgi:hypothetical protein